MSNENEPTTLEEALERYIEYRTRFERLENEFDEYQQSSLNYEQELEIQLKQLDSQTHRLQQDLFLERTQNEQYRERSEETIKRFDQQFDQIQEELNTCKKLNIKLTQYIRELEQTNDDLERSKRTLLDSLSTFETKLNQALEQNALLENELDDKKQLTETVQRLRDETRDLREELDVLHKTNTEKLLTNSHRTPIVNSDRMQSILSEAGATNGTSLYDRIMRQSLPNSNDNPNYFSIPRKRTLTTTADLQISKGNDHCQSASNSTRLQSSTLMKEAFRRFSNIESILSMQRKQCQTTISLSRYNSGTNANYVKTNRFTVKQTQS